jgi:hypothetical protein
MPKINAKEARKIVDREMNPSNTPFARHIKADAKGRYSVSVRNDEYLFEEAVAFIVKHSAERAENKVKFALEDEIIFEFQLRKNQKNALNFDSNAIIKENCVLNSKEFAEERNLAKLLGGKETVHGQVYLYSDDEQTLANTARNYQFDLNRIQNRKN